MYVVAASPFAKIFQRALWPELMNNPELVNDFKTEFDIHVRRPSGDLIVQYLRPFNLATIGSGANVRARRQEEISPLYNWLTDHEETNVYGFAPLPVDAQTMVDMSTLHNIQLQGDAKEATNARKQLLKNMEDRMGDAIQKAKEISHERVLKAIRFYHECAVEQEKVNKQSNLGKYDPSPSELLGRFILKNEILRDAEDKKKMREMWDAMSLGV